MWAGVSSAFSSRWARYRGDGRYRAYASRTGSGISISRSVLTSWRMSAIGNRGARSAGPIGCIVPGWSGGGGGVRRSAAMLYQARGIRSSSRMNLVLRLPVLAIEGRLRDGLRDAEPSASGIARSTLRSAQQDLVQRLVARRAAAEVAAEEHDPVDGEGGGPRLGRGLERLGGERGVADAGRVGPGDREVGPERPCLRGPADAREGRRKVVHDRPQLGRAVDDPEPQRPDLAPLGWERARATKPH